MKVLLIAYDNDSYIHWFPLGLAYIASALRNAGHNVVIYNQDQVFGDMHSKCSESKLSLHSLTPVKQAARWATL